MGKNHHSKGDSTMKEKTVEQLQAEIQALNAQLAQEKAETDEVKREYHEKDQTLVVTFKLPNKPVGTTKSGNSRYVGQHYRYWRVPGTDLKVKLDVIRPNKGSKDE